jgi:hypothetical protein
VSANVLYMSMSLDGFIAGPNEGPGNGLGDGRHRLHEWFFTRADADGANGQIVDEFMATGAVVAGRGTVEPAGYWGGDHHDGVRIPASSTSSRSISSRCSSGKGAVSSTTSVPSTSS